MLNFVIDFQKDIWNWKRIFNKEKFLYSVERLPEKDRNFVLDLNTKNDNDCADFLLKKYSSDFRADLFMIAISGKWKEIEEKFILILEKITGKKFIFFEDKITVFFTSAPLCPYNINEKWFMIFPVGDLNYADTLIAHELLHFHFQYYYEDELDKKGVKGENFHLLKESLTFLLNEPEFNDILPASDRGYVNHQEFRKKLKEMWNKNKNFDLFINEAIKSMG